MKKESSFHFKEGYIPQVSLGSAGLKGEVCVKAVETAIRVGYQGIDTALLYGNQEEIGIAIKNSGVLREKIWVTTKVGFSPVGGDGDLIGLYSDKNLKGDESESLELCLKQLQLDFVDLLLIHNPTTSPHEYNAACLPHFFEYFNASGSNKALPFSIRSQLIQEKCKESLQKKDAKEARKVREKSWAALEKALEEKKCRFIGVSNYPVELILEMKEYAKIMPAINQLEFHPKYASPELRRVCKDLGIVLIGYGTGTFVTSTKNYAKDDYNKILEIANRMGKTPNQVALRWTTQQGIVVIPRSRTEVHQIENLNHTSFDLSPEDMEVLNSMNIDYPYYWNPLPTIQTL